MGSTSDLGRRDVIKRATAMGLIALPSAGLLSACASGGSDTTKKVAKGTKSAKNPLAVNATAGLEVVIFNGGFGDQYAKDAEKIYQSEFPKAHITHKATQDISPTLQPRFVGGTPPDLIDNSGAKAMDAPTLISKGQVAELSPLLDAPSFDDPSKKVRDTLLPGTLEMGQFGNSKTYLLNYAYTVYGIWYSQKLLNENGWTYPKTWDEMLALCAQAKKKGIAGWTYAGKYPYYLPFGLYGFIGKIGGVEVLNAIDNLEPNAWKADAVKKAFEAYAELYAKGYILKGTPGIDHIQSQTQWTKYKAVFIPDGSWVENEAKPTTPSDFQMTMAPPTGLDSSDKMPFGTLWAQAGEGYMVPAQAKNAPGGMEMLRIMLSKKSAANFSKLVSSLSCVQGATDGMALPPGLKSASGALATATAQKLVVNPRVADWYPTLEKENIGGALGEMMAGRMSATDAINAIQKAADDTAKDSSIPKYKHA